VPHPGRNDARHVDPPPAGIRIDFHSTLVNTGASTLLIVVENTWKMVAPGAVSRPCSISTSALLVGIGALVDDELLGAVAEDDG